MQKFLLRLGLSVTPLMLLLVTVNYLGDAARFFEPDFEQKIVRVLQDHPYCTNIANFDERIFQKALIQQVDTPPEVLVLGSSRTMIIGQAIDSSKHYYNASVPSASLQDLAALFQVFQQEGKLPAHVMLGVDPWNFYERFEGNQWGPLAEEYYAFVEKENTYQPSAGKSALEVLFSLSYFQRSLPEFPKWVRGMRDPQPASQPYNVQMTRARDGSQVYPAGYDNISTQRKLIKVEAYITDRNPMQGFDKIAPEKWDLFRRLVTRMQAQGVDVAIFLCPLHPRLYEEVVRHNSVIHELEEKLASLAQEKQLTLRGSFSPDLLGFDDSFFYDATHCNAKGIRCLLNATTNKY